MALNIPLPGSFGDALMKGVDTGSNFFSRLMQPILEREKQAQLERHFQEQLKLSKAAAGRAAQGAALKNQAMQQKMNLLAKIQEMAAGGNVQPTGAGELPSSLPEIPSMASGSESANAGSINPIDVLAEEQTPAPEINTNATSEFDIAQHSKTINGLPLDYIMQAITAKQLGLPVQKFGASKTAPLTQEEKNQAALNLFKEKEEYKSQQEQKMPAAIKTLHENIIHLSPKAIQAIDHIINIPSPTEIPGLGVVKSGQKAAHNKAVTAAAENYAKAKGWPNTKGSIEKAESILQRGNFETDFDYRKRLREYQQELKQGIKSSNDFLHPGKQTEEPKENIIEYVRVNGKIVPKGGA